MKVVLLWLGIGLMLVPQWAQAQTETSVAKRDATAAQLVRIFAAEVPRGNVWTEVSYQPQNDIIEVKTCEPFLVEPDVIINDYSNPI